MPFALKSRLILLVVCLLALISAPAFNAQPETGIRWAGADALTTYPVTCPAAVADAPPVTFLFSGLEDALALDWQTIRDAIERSAQSATRPAFSEPEPPPYIGGQPRNPRPRQGEMMTMVDIPKLLGVSYYNAIHRGMQEAVLELANVEMRRAGPIHADAEAQALEIARNITPQTDGLLVAPNNEASIAPALEEALDQGVRVVTYDADIDPDVRQWAVLPAQPHAIARALVDRLVDEAGPNARFIIVTPYLEAPNQARWIAEMWAYARICHPDLQWLATVEAQDDANVAYNLGRELIRDHGSRLDAIVALSDASMPALAEAVAEARRCSPDDAVGDVGAPDAASAIAVVGTAMPQSMRAFIDNGCVESVVTWNPADLGYAAVYALRAITDGQLTPDAPTLNTPRLGALDFWGAHIILGEPQIITETNLPSEDVE